MKKFLLLTMMCTIALTIASSCSDDKDEPKVPFTDQIENNVANIYWKVVDTQIVDKEGNKHTIDKAVSKDLLGVGELLMDGLFVKDNTVRYFSTPFMTFYVDMPVTSIAGNTMKFSEYDVCPEIIFESIAPDEITVTYWHDTALLDVEATERTGTTTFQKGAYFKSVLRKAPDKDILRFENAVDVRMVN